MGIMTLLIDNSNTRTKLRFLYDEKLSDECLVLPTAQVSAESLLNITRGRDIKHVLCASVVPRAAAEVRLAFGQSVEFVTGEGVLNFSLDYPGASTLGADRIANVAGMVQLGRVPGIAIDFGTATTFDVVVPGDSGARFIGGSIAPGLPAMASYLANCTAQLPMVQLVEPPHAIGRNTVEAIQSGCLYGYSGLVRGLVSSISQEIGCKPYVIVTGGDAERLLPFLPEVDLWEPLLTFRGLQALAERIW